MITRLESALPRWVALLALMSAGIHAAPAWQSSGEMSIGYDSNPAQTHDPIARSFIHTALNTVYQQSFPTLDFELSASGWLRTYHIRDNTSRIEIAANWSQPVARERGLFTFTLAAAAFHDTLVPADERNEAALTLRYDHTLTARDAIGLQGEARQLAYVHAAMPWAGRPGGTTPPPRQQSRAAPPPAADLPPDAVARDRDDTLTQISVDATHHWLPTLASVITFTRAQSDSTLPTEARSYDGISGLVRWEPAAQWQMQLGGDWTRLRYDALTRQPTRTDTQRTVTAELQHTLTAGRHAPTAFCRLTWLDSDSTRPEHAFQQQVSSCGVAWDF